MTDFKLVPLKEIKPDPNQPRKFYDEVAMAELTESVKAKGILQPILLRPNGKGLIVVCGERRYKAATSAGLTEIPAVIRELTDDEALELQIIENLQRKDVHPMEEAVAFKSLSDKGKDIKEIAVRVGKSEFYARQRIKLCSLSKEWQQVFFANRISISDALKVALFEPKIQKELYESEADDNVGDIELSTWTLRRYRGDLNDASFDLADASLDKKMGACTNCKFNSATAALFPEAEKNARCMNISCFKNKSDLHFNREFSIAIEEPTIILVHDSYSNDNVDKWVKKAKETGQPVYGAGRYREEQKPDPVGTFEEWCDEYNNDPKAPESFKDYQSELKDYDKDLKEYENKIAGGKYKKALMLTGDNRGKYIFIHLSSSKPSSSGSSKATKEKESAGKLTSADIENEIARIREKEKRTKQIDENNIWKEMKTHFRPQVNVDFVKGDLSQIEREAIAVSLYNKLGFGSADEFEKFFKLQKSKTKTSGYSRHDWDFSKVTDAQLRQMMRFFFLDVLPPSLLYSGYNSDSLLCMKVAGEYFPDVMKDIVDKQAAKTKARGERIDKRIKDLQAKKKELGEKKTKAKK